MFDGMGPDSAVQCAAVKNVGIRTPGRRTAYASGSESPSSASISSSTISTMSTTSASSACSTVNSVGTWLVSP